MSKGAKVGERRAVPGEKGKELLKLRNEYVPRGGFHTAPVFIAKGKGALAEDVDGNEYIDFCGGIACLNTGHCHEKVVAAVKDQVDKFMHVSFNVFMYESFVQLAKEICESTPGDFPKKAYFFNNGAEAVENAVKIARRYTGRYNILAFEHAFHGRTLLTMGLTSKVKYYKYGFGTTDIGIMRAPYAYCYRCPHKLSYPGCGMHCLNRIEDMFKTYSPADSIAAILVEPILGEGGYVVPPKEFIKGLRDLCNKHGILFIADEIQAGMGRAGKMWAIEHFDVVPDLMAIGKSLSGGMVLTGTVGRADVMDSVETGGIGGTFSGHPPACVAALEVLKVFKEEKLVDRSAMLGKLAKDRMEEMKRKYSIIGNVNGIGSMLGLELVKDRKTKEPAAAETKEIMKNCHEHGLMIMNCGTLGNVLRFIYPLVIKEEELIKGLDILENAIKETSKAI